MYCILYEHELNSSES